MQKNILPDFEVQSKCSTTDDWHPSFDPPEDGFGGFVVSIVNYKRLSLSFWGNDDFYMKRFSNSERELRRFICHLPCVISQDWLEFCEFRSDI